MTDPAPTITDHDLTEQVASLVNEWFDRWWPAAGVPPRRALFALLRSGPLADRLTAPQPCPTCVREGGPYRCCPHCADDPAAHEAGQRDHHDLPCTTCVRDALGADRHTAAARDAAALARVEALAKVLTDAPGQGPLAAGFIFAALIGSESDAFEDELRRALDGGDR